MGLTDWLSIDGLVAPGTQVTAVPWPNWGYALFVTGADGGVYAAGGDPQRGLAGPWARAGGLAVAPGTPVTAVPWPNWGYALFATGSDGGVYAAGGDPQRGLAGEWGRAGGLVAAPGTPVTAVPWPNWGYALFVTRADGGVYAAGGDPQRGLAGEWASVSEGSAPPGSLVTAVQWKQGFALFITDPNGGIFATTGDPQNGFGPWTNVGGIRAKPGSPVTAVAFGDKLALFVADANGTIHTKASSGGERRQLRATATIKIAHGSFPDPVIVPDVLMSFKFNSDTRGFTVEEGFSPVTLHGSGGSISTLTIQFDSAGEGRFETDGQITIPNFKIKGTATIHDVDLSGDSTFVLSTGSATSGRYTETGSPADSPADGLGNVTLVGAGQISGIDFSIRLVGC